MDVGKRRFYYRIGLVQSRIEAHMQIKQELEGQTAVALTTQQRNFLTRIEQMGLSLIPLEDELRVLSQEWFENAHNSRITDAELQAVGSTENEPPFAHLTSEELTNVIFAFGQLVDLLGAHRAKFLRLRR